MLSADVLRPGLEIALQRLSTETMARGALEAERTRIARELSNLAAAVAAGADVQTLVVEIKKREARQAEIIRELARPVSIGRTFAALSTRRSPTGGSCCTAYPHMAARHSDG